MNDVLANITLVGAGPVAAIGGIAVVFVVLTVLLWRGHKVWRWVCAVLAVFFVLAAVADGINTKYSYYDNVAQFAGLPTYPTADVPEVDPGGGPQPQVAQQPDGAVTKIPIPDTESHFGSFDANVWLPPQYFSDLRAHFPVIILTHGNPGSNNDWLNGSAAAATGLASAKAGKPVILVFPTVLQNGFTGDSLCVDTQSNGNAETYLVKDVVSAVDKTFRTNSNAKGRAIGGLSMGGFCALNLGLKHPDVFSVALDFSGETVPTPDTLPGGLQQLFGANWQQQADANNPTKYYTQLDASKGPAIWMGVGTSDTTILEQMQDLAPKLKAKGFTVELHTTAGAHDFATFGVLFKDAMPWAANLLYS